MYLQTQPQYIYEVIGDTITGGDSVDTHIIEAGNHRNRKFTTVGNATTIIQVLQ